MVIDYEKMVGEYMNGLATKLRKFSPSEEFLSMWVPDEDHARSILNMAEVARLDGLPSLSIAITTEEIIDCIDFTQLKISLEGTAAVAVRNQPQGGVVVDLEFERTVPLTALEVADVPTLYRLVFNYDDAVADFGKTVEPQEGLVAVSACHCGITLRANVHPEKHIVRMVGYEGPTTEVAKKLMNKLCLQLLDKPVNECHDHAVIFLEYSLRDPSCRRIAAGITLPSNVWKVLGELTHLVRNLVADYRSKTGYVDQANFYTAPISARWRALPDEEKKAELTAAIGAYLEERKIDPSAIVVKDIRRNQKVVLETAKEIGDHASTVLLELEVYLRHAVEAALAIYNEEEPDQNKMRWDRPAVKSQVVRPKHIVAKGGL